MFDDIARWLAGHNGYVAPELFVTADEYGDKVEVFIGDLQIWALNNGHWKMLCYIYDGKVCYAH